MKYIALLPSLLIMATSCNIKQLQIAQAENSNAASSVTLKNVSRSLVKADSMYVCSLNMFERIHQECDSNIIFSPLGVEALFRMLQDGAGGNTASDLQQVMGVSSEEISNMTHALLDKKEHCRQGSRHADVRMANLIAMNKGCTLRNAYRDSIRSRYDAEVMHLNFARQQSTAAINEWVREHTNGMIDRIIDGLDATTVMCAVNALYFKGTWAHIFEKENTKEKAFHQYDGKSTTVAMMQHEKLHYYTANDTMQVVSLSYEPRCSNSESHRNFSMYVMLPMKGKTIDDVIAYMHRHDITDIRKTMSHQTVNLQLPRFTTETQCNVLSILRSLGVRHLDDFPGISPDMMMVNKALQRSKIEVDEYGTKAAAATATLYVGAWPSRHERIHNFIANRPFIYMIVDDETHTIYFMGQYTRGTILDGETLVSKEYTQPDDNTDEQPLSYVRDNGEAKVLKAKEVIATEPIRPVDDGNPDRVYDVVEKMPSFPGGFEALMAYLEKSIIYPPEASRKKIEGRVIVQFIVSEKGKISDIKVAKKVDPLLDQEAVRVVRKMPRWNPGTHRDKPVKARYTLPITFRLDTL